MLPYERCAPVFGDGTGLDRVVWVRSGGGRFPASRSITFLPRSAPVWGEGLGCGVWGLGFGIWGWEFGVWGLGFGVWDLGIGVRV